MILATNNNGRPNQGDAPVIAIVGCGAITEALHLPALSSHPEVMAKAVCVDRNLARAKEMMAKFGAARAVERYQDVMPEVDGAIVAVPPKLHYPITMDLLAAKVHVLCEKPLTESAGNARELVAKADEMGVSLCVNNYFRLYPSSIKMRDLITSGELGAIRRVEFSWGELFDWPVASGAYFGVAGAGRGVLADKGAHLLDLICWWLGAKPEVLSYQDDFMGGTEAVAELRFQVGKCEGLVKLSWLSRYANTFEISGEKATVAGRLFDWNTLDLRRAAGRPEKLRLASGAKVSQDLGKVLLENFVQVVQRRAVPVVAGSDVLPSIELLDDCYAHRKRISMPWYDAWRRVSS
jgi:predicted dehydrogenase